MRVQLHDGDVSAVLRSDLTCVCALLFGDIGGVCAPHRVK